MQNKRAKELMVSAVMRDTKLFSIFEDSEVFLCADRKQAEEYMLKYCTELECMDDYDPVGGIEEVSPWRKVFDYEHQKTENILFLLCQMPEIVDLCKEGPVQVVTAYL